MLCTFCTCALHTVFFKYFSWLLKTLKHLYLLREGVVHISCVLWALLTWWSLTLWLTLIKWVLQPPKKQRIIRTNRVVFHYVLFYKCVCTCNLMLDRMMRRVILLSEAELRSLSKFLFMRYCLNAVWIVFAARRDTNGPPYFLSSISTYQAVRSRNQSEREEQKRSLHLQETGNKTVETFSEPLWCSCYDVCSFVFLVSKPKIITLLGTSDGS